MPEKHTLLDSDRETIMESGKFFGEANKKFAGNPKGLLEKTAEKIDWPG
jgi:hypothetical protein